MQEAGPVAVPQAAVLGNNDARPDSDDKVPIGFPVPDRESELERNQPKRKAVFWCRDEGVYFTFTSTELKIRACRTIVAATMLVTFFLVYYLSFGLCDVCILIATLGSCAGKCVGLDFLHVSCWAGVLASVLRGFRVGSEIATVDVKLKFR